MQARRTSPRERLLAAGRELLEQRGVGFVTPDTVSTEAGLKPGRFKRAFASNDAFLLELMEILGDEVRDSLAKLTLNMPPGLPRMKLTIDSYLAANVQRPALRELVDTLRTDAAGAEAVRRRVAAFTMMMELELKSVKWPQAAAAARLLTAAIVEISLAEYEAGESLPELRATLYNYLERAAI
jgi:AcrR family transcriptional regulator